MAKQKLTFEASMQRLDEIVKQLEKGDVPLDASLALFEEGSRLLAACNEMLEHSFLVYSCDRSHEDNHVWK